MQVVEEFLNKIMPVIEADNRPENIRLYLRGILTKLYDEGFYQGTMNVIREDRDGS